MSYSKQKTDQNQNTHHRRIIKDHQLCPHCHGVINPSTVCAILAPQFTDSSSDSICLCNCKSYKVTAKPKVKWAPDNNGKPAAYKTTTSKYHTRCIEQPKKPKLKISVPKKLIVSNAVYTGSIDTDVDKNVCYCRKKKIPPLLPCKPFDSQTPGIKNDKGRCKLQKQEANSSHTLPTLRKAKELLDYRPESEFLKRLRKAAKETFDCQCIKCKLEDEIPNLKFTASRQLLEEHYDDAKKYNINEICRDQHSCLKYTSKESCMNEQSISKATNCATIHSIRQIRDENYFDTHSTEYLDRQRVPEHVCEHNFALNGRLLPVAMNTDPYGVSRCRICNKPMEDVFVEYKNRPVPSSLQRLDSADVSQYFTTINSYSDEQTTANSRYASKAIQTTPKIRVKNHIIYLHVPLIADPRITSMKRPYIPENSWALRYQKMY